MTLRQKALNRGPTGLTNPGTAATAGAAPLVPQPGDVAGGIAGGVGDGPYGHPKAPAHPPAAPAPVAPVVASAAPQKRDAPRAATGFVGGIMKASQGLRPPAAVAPVAAAPALPTAAPAISVAQPGSRSEGFDATFGAGGKVPLAGLQSGVQKVGTAPRGDPLSVDQWQSLKGSIQPGMAGGSVGDAQKATNPDLVPLDTPPSVGDAGPKYNPVDGQIEPIRKMKQNDSFLPPDALAQLQAEERDPLQAAVTPIGDAQKMRAPDEGLVPFDEPRRSREDVLAERMGGLDPLDVERAALMGANPYTRGVDRMPPVQPVPPMSSGGMGAAEDLVPLDAPPARGDPLSVDQWQSLKGSINATGGSMGPGADMVPLPPPPVGGALGGAIAPAAASSGTSPIDPANDLRYQNILPTDSARLQKRQGLADQALEKVGSGPSRSELAGQRFDEFASRTNPEFERSIKLATEAAAAHGGLRSGMLTTQYGTLAGDRTRELTNERSRLLTDSLEGDIGDRYQNAGLFQDAENDVQGDDRYARNEQRGERDYQVGRADDAYNRQRQGVLDSEMLTGGQFDRDLALGQFGERNSPAELEMLGADQLGQESRDAGSAAGDLMQQNALRQILAQQQAGGSAPVASAPAPAPSGNVLSDILGNGDPEYQADADGVIRVPGGPGSSGAMPGATPPFVPPRRRSFLGNILGR